MKMLQAWLNKDRRPPTLAPRVYLPALTSVLTAETYDRLYFVFRPYFVFLFSGKNQIDLWAGVATQASAFHR